LCGQFLVRTGARTVSGLAAAGPLTADRCRACGVRSLAASRKRCARGAIRGIGNRATRRSGRLPDAGLSCKAKFLLRKKVCRELLTPSVGAAEVSAAEPQPIAVIGSDLPIEEVMAQLASVQDEDSWAQVRCGMVERVAGRTLGIGPDADAIPWPGPSAGSITQPAEPWRRSSTPTRGTWCSCVGMRSPVQVGPVVRT